MLNHLVKILQKQGVKVTESDFVVPPQLEMGDFSLPCFKLAKQAKKSPVDLAKDLASKIKSDKTIKKVEGKGPYLNFFIRREVLNKSVLMTVGRSLRGSLRSREIATSASRLPRNDKVMVEFFHANTHKAVHVGHIRNMILGESLARFLEERRVKVIRVNYQGDIGPHVAKTLWAFLQIRNSKSEIRNKNKSLSLAELYQKGHKAYEENDKAKEEIQEINKKLYSGDKKLMKIWKETRKWCLDDFEKLYEEFDTKFDRLYFESEMEKEGLKTVQDLVKKKIAKQSEGAIIVDLEKEGLGVIVLVTSEGTVLYGAKDLALAKLKIKEYPKLDLSIHVVGQEQELYFKQLFSIFKKMKLPLAGKSRHLVYGLVNLPSGKISSRAGQIVAYQDVKNELLKLAGSETKKRHSDWKEEQIKEAAQKIAFSALKFSMLKSEKKKNIVFDIKQALAFEGDTGPYLLYTFARINSIFRKIQSHESRSREVDFGVLKEKEERLLVRELGQFGKVVENAAENYEPSLLCGYLLDLAHSFNEFYHKHQVLKAENEELKKARLLLSQAVSVVLEKGLGLLGIEVVEEM